MVATIARRELFERVWSAPMREVAEALDCDYWLLRQLCDRYEIPKPPKGHWAKVRHGAKSAHRPPLPEGRHVGDIPLPSGNEARREREGSFDDLFALSYRRVGPLALLHSDHPQDRVHHLRDVVSSGLERMGFEVRYGEKDILAIVSPYHTTKVRVRERLKLIKSLVPGQRHPRRGEREAGRYHHTTEPSGVVEIQCDGTRTVDEATDDLADEARRLLARLMAQRDVDDLGKAEADRLARLEAIARVEQERQHAAAAAEAAAFGEFMAMAAQWTSVAKGREFLDAMTSAGADGPMVEWLAERLRQADPLNGGPQPALNRVQKIRGSP